MTFSALASEDAVSAAATIDSLVVAQTTGPEIWREAGNLLGRQPELRSSLLSIFQSTPKSGLYADERHDNLDGTQSAEHASDDLDGTQSAEQTSGEGSSTRSPLASFVRYVRASLALSPRTVLRRAADGSLAEIMESKREQFAELYNLLGINQEADITRLSEAVEALPAGRLYSRWRSADSTTNRTQNCSILSERAISILRRRVVDGLHAQTRKLGSSEGGDNVKMPSDAEVEQAVKNAIELEEARQRHAAERAAERATSLEEELKSDSEYRRYTRVRDLWALTGAQKLWQDYKAADRAEGRERRNCGAAFEEQCAPVCFASIALLLSRTTGRPISSYSYVRGARWYDGTKPIGEVDLVVLCDGCVAALCEMKAGCVEIAPAFQQHESKLYSALKPNAQEALNEVVMRATDGTTVFSLPSGKDANVPIFVATLLPSNNRNILGVEPALLYEICEGIRAQGLQVRDYSTTAAAKTIPPLSELDDGGLSRWTSTLAATAPKGEGRTDPTRNQSDNINLTDLERFVRSRESLCLSESPAGCLSRRGEHILVLPGGATTK